MKIPTPWGNNNLDQNFKNWLEEIRQFIVNVFNKTDKDYKRVNKRVSNLVISSCENNDNEVKDSRTDIDGNSHDSLYDRLVHRESFNNDEFKKQTDISENIRENLNDLSNKVSELYDEEVEATNVYVSQENGDDGNGDGTEELPFKTIQKAIDSLPVISVSSFFIILDKGAYKEDVVISNKIATSIEIKAFNTEIVSSHDGDTGVFVRSVKAIGTTAYIALRGLSQFDHKNGPLYFVFTDRVKYIALDNLSLIENTKNTDEYQTMKISGTNGHIYKSVISNQKSVLSAEYTASVICGWQNIGTGNTRVITSDRSIVFKMDDFKVTGTTLITKNNGGQVFE